MIVSQIAMNQYTDNFYSYSHLSPLSTALLLTSAVLLGGTGVLIANPKLRKVCLVMGTELMVAWGLHAPRIRIAALYTATAAAIVILFFSVRQAQAISTATISTISTARSTLSSIGQTLGANNSPQ